MREAVEYPGTSYIPEVEDAARKAQERRLVEEGSALWARRKEELSRQKRRDQLQLRKMLAQYYPWGKPGGGAPCAATLRKKNVRLYSPEPVQRNYSSCKALKPPGTTERLKLSFSGGDRDVPAAVPRVEPGRRYPQTPQPRSQPLGHFIEEQYRCGTERQQKQRHRRHLDPVVAGRRKAKEEELTKIRDYEKKLLEHPSPWGRPGPGGAPWRDPKLLGDHFLSSMGWTYRSPGVDRNYIDPLAVTDMDKFYDAKATYGITPDPHPGSMPPLDSKHRYNEDVKVYQLTGGVELVPLLTNSRYQSEPHAIRYLATDATRPGYTLESLKALKALSSGNREYVSELAEQIHRKREKIMEEQRREQENCRRHYDTWRRLWGRPGHGAPIDHSQRTNLHNILYRPAIY